MNAGLQQFMAKLKHTNTVHSVSIVSVDFCQTVDVTALYQLAYG